MLVSRRDFIHAGCTVAAASLVPDPVKAWVHGSIIGNQNRVTINALGSGNQPYANYAKSINWGVIDPTIVDSNGYFISPTTIASPIRSQVSFDPNYYGHYIWKWTGTGTMWMQDNVIVYNTKLNGVQTGGVVQGVAGTSGWVSGAIIAAQNTPSVEFALGVLISGMTGATGGTSGQIIVTVSTTTNVPTNVPIKIQNQTGQAAATGLWNFTVLNSTQIQLTTNAVTSASSAYNNSDPWVSGGEAISPHAATINFGNAGGGTFTSFNNLVFCKTANEAIVDAGQINDPDYVTTLKALFNHASAPLSNRGWLRFLDLDGERGYQCDSALRIPKTALTYNNFNGTYFTPQAATGTYWGGTITTADGTAFTVPNPTGRGVGAYADSEIVQGIFNLTSPTTNTSTLPTLNVGSRGAAPIFVEGDVANPHIVFASAPASAGLTYIFSFQASWLNGGVAASFTYTSVAGDVGNLNTFYGNMAAAMTADATIGTTVTKINFFLSADLHIMCRSAAAGALTVTYTGGTGAAATITKVPASSFTTGNYTTFVYSSALGGWVWQGNGSGMVMSVPWEQIVELCNLVGAHCWINWPLLTKAQYITDQTNFFGDATTGLTSGLRFGTETANEVWNFSAPGPYDQSLWLGSSIGLQFPSEGCVWGYTALKCLQYASLSKTAWTGKGRSISDHYIFLIGRSAEAGPSSNFDTSGLKGTFLTTSNAVYAAYSGLAGGPAAASYNASPNRPCDTITASGMATYWWSGYIGETASEIGGTVLQNATWLQAAKDYGNGLTASAFAALVTINTATTGPGNPGQSLGNFGASQFPSFESTVAQYDSGRASLGVAKLGILHYEGAPQWSFNSNSINGTNSTSDSASLTALQNQITALSWNVSAYTLSGTNSASEMAQMCLNLIQGWKNDTDHTGAAANTGSYKSMIKTYYYQALVNASAGNGREVKPAQYGIEGNTWGLYPVDYRYGNPYTNYSAISEWNAGS